MNIEPLINPSRRTTDLLNTVAASKSNLVNGNTKSEKWKLPNLELVRGLFFDPKWIQAKYFCDEERARLFDLLCETPEYYAHRAELEIIEQNSTELAALAAEAGGWIDLGSGATEKSKFVFAELANPLPVGLVDVSGNRLADSGRFMRSRFERFPLEQVRADYTTSNLNDVQTRGLVYLHGQTFGNFEPRAGQQLVMQILKLSSARGGVLIGVDLAKDIHVLELAYNDRFGVSAEYSLNLLKKLNVEFNVNLNLSKFRHLAFYNSEENRIEIHIQSICAQATTVMGRKIYFREGETIHTQNAYKQTVEDIVMLARATNLKIRRVFTDSQKMFALIYLTH